MMADDLALQGPHPHLANGSRRRSNLLPYQPHGFTDTIPKAVSQTQIPSNVVLLCPRLHVIGPRTKRANHTG